MEEPEEEPEEQVLQESVQESSQEIVVEVVEKKKPEYPTRYSQVLKLNIQRQFEPIDGGRRLRHMKDGYIVINDLA